MKKSVNKILAGLMAVSLLAGCGANSQSASENQSPAVTQGGAQKVQETVTKRRKWCCLSISNSSVTTPAFCLWKRTEIGRAHV